MAGATTVSFGKIKVSLGNGATPEVFAEPCGFNSKSFSLTKDTNTTVVPDCTAPDAAAWTEKDIVSRSATISGDGVMATESFATWRGAYEADTSKNMRIEVDEYSCETAAGIGRESSTFPRSSFELSAAIERPSPFVIDNDGPVLVGAGERVMARSALPSILSGATTLIRFGLASVSLGNFKQRHGGNALTAGTITSARQSCSSFLEQVTRWSMIFARLFVLA
jgi:hypothetical protein